MDEKFVELRRSTIELCNIVHFIIKPELVFLEGQLKRKSPSDGQNCFKSFSTSDKNKVIADNYKQSVEFDSFS
jgi:hypothetical protein